MNYREAATKLSACRVEIGELRKRMRALQASVEPEPVVDYQFTRSNGEAVTLSQLFGAHDTLILIHNMGQACPYCTLWADGFNGVFEHLDSRAAFVLSSPDQPDVQRSFAASRGWRFPMVSHARTSFAADMGYAGKNGYLPGVSVFRLRDGKVERVADTGFEPGDDFCAVWHLFDLIPDGAAGWRPRFDYASRAVA